MSLFCVPRPECWISHLVPKKSEIYGCTWCLLQSRSMQNNFKLKKLKSSLAKKRKRKAFGWEVILSLWFPASYRETKAFICDCSHSVADMSMCLMSRYLFVFVSACTEFEIVDPRAVVASTFSCLPCATSHGCEPEWGEYQRYFMTPCRKVIFVFCQFKKGK